MVEGPVAVIEKEFIFLGDLAPGDEIIIDSERMTALLNGQDVRHLVRGEYPMIVPGAQELEYSDEEGTRKVKISLHWRERWL